MNRSSVVDRLAIFKRLFGQLGRAIVAVVQSWPQ